MGTRLNVCGYSAPDEIDTQQDWSNVSTNGSKDHNWYQNPIDIIECSHWR
jgi:hypothetical protein